MASQRRMRKRAQHDADLKEGLEAIRSLPRPIAMAVLLLLAGIFGFGVWWTIHLLTTESLLGAIILLILSYVGFSIVIAAIIFIARGMALVGMAAVLTGRGVYRLFTRRSRNGSGSPTG